MSKYCIYTITDEERHFSGCCTIINCANDKEAILAAEQCMKHSRGGPTAVQQQHQVQPKDESE
jgi:hypothetical protein